MKKALLIGFIFLAAQAVCQFTDSDLPIVVINTPGAQSIPDDPRIDAEMGIIYNGVGVRNYMTDPFNNFHGDISIEVRGSTSQQYPKKNYGFETQTPGGLNWDVSLIDLPPENDWILYGPYPDKTLVRNVMTFDLARKFGNYAARTAYCELVLNGQYMGLYVLMEKIKRDAARVNVTELDSSDISGSDLTGGYIMKVDKLTGSVVDTFTSWYNPEVHFQYHDPEPDVLLPVQKSYIKSYIQDFETALWGPNFDDPILGYPPLIHEQTFWDFFILQELGRTVDGYRSSSFLYKDHENVWNGELKAGPMWDFNLSYGNADYCDADLTTGWQYEFDLVCPWFTSSVPFWWGKLLTDTTYANGLRCRWETLRAGPLHVDTLHAWIDSVTDYVMEARIRNFTEWPIIGVYVNWNGFVGQTYQEDVDYLKWYLQQRIAWLDANIPGTCWPSMLGVEDNQPEVAKSRAWPNPFHDELYIGYSTPESGRATVTIYNAFGQMVQQHVQDVTPGNHVIEMSPDALPAGLFTYTIELEGRMVDQGKLIHR